MAPFFLLFLLASVVEFPEKGQLGDSRRGYLTVDGTKRTYLYLDGAPDAPSKPLVIFLHGGTQTDEQAWRQTSFPTLAKSNGFLFVAPQGQNNQWNDGRPETLSGVRSTADDVAFLKSLIASLAESHHADPKRVFLAGVSNGGLMTMRFACEAGSALRAAGTAIANLPTELERKCPSRTPLPILQMNSTADPLIPFSGNAQFLSAERTFAFWATRSGCSAKEEAARLPHRVPSDTTYAVQHTRLHCPGEPSAFIVFHGAGHSAPNQKYGPLLERALGKSNQDVDLGEAMWEFFRRASEK